MGFDKAINMRQSKVLQKLRSGQVASCIKLNLTCPRIAEIMAMTDVDCLWTCMEHAPNDLSVVEEQIRAAKIYDTDVLVRTERGGYSNYIRPLELDAAGIMVPHVMSLEDAKDIVRMTRFHPIGRRPVDGGNADGGYCRIPTLEYYRQANEQRFLVVQIEDPEPVGDLEEIAKLDGIDVIFLGPADFTHGIGTPNDWENPKFVEIRKRIPEVCAANGKFAGTTGSPETIDTLIELGYKFISMGADVLALSDYAENIAAEFEKRRLPKK